MVPHSFRPFSSGVQLAVLSDDGVSITIIHPASGMSVDALSNYGTGQAMPDLNQSLKEVPFEFEVDQTYDISIHYHNTYYTGDGDIDGLKMFAFAGMAVAEVRDMYEFRPAPGLTLLSFDSDSSTSQPGAGTMPRSGTKVSAGQIVTFQLSVEDTDELRVLPQEQEFTEREIPNDWPGKVEATITLTNAFFPERLSEVKMCLWREVMASGSRKTSE